MAEGEHLVRADEFWKKLRTDPFADSGSPQALITLIHRELASGDGDPAWLDRPESGGKGRGREEMERELYRVAMLAEVRKAGGLIAPWRRRSTELSSFDSEAMLSTYIGDRLEMAYRFAHKVDKRVTTPGSLSRRREELTLEELVPLCEAAKKNLLLLKIWIG